MQDVLDQFLLGLGVDAADLLIHDRAVVHAQCAPARPLAAVVEGQDDLLLLLLGQAGVQLLDEHLGRLGLLEARSSRDREAAACGGHGSDSTDDANEGGTIQRRGRADRFLTFRALRFVQFVHENLDGEIVASGPTKGPDCHPTGACLLIRSVFTLPRCDQEGHDFSATEFCLGTYPATIPVRCQSSCSDTMLVSVTAVGSFLESEPLMNIARQPSDSGANRSLDDHPFRYGYRWVAHTDEQGREKWDTEPLTEEDVLHPRLEDHVTQNEPHNEDCIYLKGDLSGSGGGPA